MDQQYEEISLRELIENLLKNKWLIIIITLGVLFLAGFYTFVLADNVYEAKATVQVNQGERDNFQMPEDVTDILDNLSLYSYGTMEAYREQLLSNEVLIDVIEKLSLDVNVEELYNKFSISGGNETNLITITARDTDPEKAALLANTLADCFAVYITKIQEAQLSKSTEILENQLAVERDKLDEALLAYKVLLAVSRDTEAIGRDIGIQNSALSAYKSKLVTLTSTYEEEKIMLELQIKKTESMISSLGGILSSLDQTFTLDQSIYEDNVTAALANSISEDLALLSSLGVSKEEVNPVYVSTLEQLTNKKIELLDFKEELILITNKYNYDQLTLSEDITIAEETLDLLKVEHAEREIEERMVERQVEIAQQTYDAFNDKLELTRVATASRISENNVILVSSAISPNVPVAPNRLLTLAIGGILGLMLGVFIAFFKEYWISSDPKTA